MCFRHTGKSERHVMDSLNSVSLSIVQGCDRDSTMSWSTSNGRVLDILVKEVIKENLSVVLEWFAGTKR